MADTGIGSVCRVSDSMVDSLSVWCDSILALSFMLHSMASLVGYGFP